MTLDSKQLRELCRRRDAGVVAGAAPTDELAERLLAGASPEERQALIEGGRAARQEMIEANLGLVGFATARFLPAAALEREDYFQEGVLGLAAAVDRFDPDRSDYFSSFALPHIRGAVIDLVSTRGGDLRPSQGQTAIRVEREVARREALGLPTRTAEIARSLQIKERAVVQSMAYRQPTGLPWQAARRTLSGIHAASMNPDRRRRRGCCSCSHRRSDAPWRRCTAMPLSAERWRRSPPVSASARGSSARSSTPVIVISGP